MYITLDMVKDHSDSNRGNSLATLHGLLFPIRSGQVRVFNVHIQSKLLLHTSVTGTSTGLHLHRFLCLVQGSTRSPTGIGSRRRAFRLAARVLLYAPSHRHDSTYHSVCYTGYGALAGTGNSSMGPWRILLRTTHTIHWTSTIPRLLPFSNISK